MFVIPIKRGENQSCDSNTQTQNIQSRKKLIVFDVV
jgi:hypothetical protein